MTVVLTNIRVWDTGERITVRMPDSACDGAETAQSESAQIEHVIDASAWIIAPGFADPHVHFRDPGQTEKEDMISGSRAAAAGGYTSVLIMPNTVPAMDGITYDGVNALEVVDGYEADHETTLPVRYAMCVSASKERAGCEASDIEDWHKYCFHDELADVKHPIIAISDDGSAVPADIAETVARHAIKANIPFIEHCEHHDIGVMNEGETSAKLGLPGIPASTELDIVKRDIELARQTGVRLHLQHVSTAEAFEAIREAKREGLNISCETAPHYIALDDKAVEKYCTYAKMNPPLRSAADRIATAQAVCDGTVDMLATDHAPHTVEEKAAGMIDAPNGIIGLETAYPVAHTSLVDAGYIDDARLIELMSTEPLALMNQQAFDISAYVDAETGTLDLNSDEITALCTDGISRTDDNHAHPDCVILSPDEKWVIRADEFESRARNTPFDGWEVSGRVIATVCNGVTTYSRLRHYV